MTNPARLFVTPDTVEAEYELIPYAACNATSAAGPDARKRGLELWLADVFGRHRASCPCDAAETTIAAWIASTPHHRRTARGENHHDDRSYR